MKILHVHNVAFVATTLVDALNNTEGVDAIFFERERYSEGVFNHFKNMIKFKKLVHEEKPDIIHVHYLPTSLYALFARKGFILHVHGSDIRGLSNISKKYCIKEKIYRRFKKYILGKAQLVFYSTPDLKKDVEVIREDAVFIPNPVKVKVFMKEDYKIKENEIKLLFFSSLSDAKGADIAFQALKEIKKIYGEKIIITCINFGKEKEKYNKYDFINYVNKVKHEDINNFLLQFDIIIGQLKSGGIGVSELEVMMLGIPLISYFKYNEFYPEQCPLISCESPDKIINEINTILYNKKFIEEISRKQYDWVVKYHSSNNVVLKILECYKSILQLCGE